MADWRIPSPSEVPAAFIAAVRGCKSTINGRFAAQLLWQIASNISLKVRLLLVRK
jgi:hypothetical protein